MSEWTPVCLGDVLSVKYGKDHKSIGDGSIQCYGSGGLMRTVNRYLSKGPSVLIPRKGSLSNIFFVKQPFWTVDTLFWTEIDQRQASPVFVYYKALTIDWESMNVGSAVPSLTSKIISSLEIQLPPLREQEAIAEVLSSLDDKIDLLKRQNKTLEGMAEALFRQWFIEEAQDDWEEVELGDLIEIRNGKDHKHLADGDIPVYGSGGLMRKADGFLFDGESILLPRKGTLNNVMVVNEAFWTVDTMFYTEMKRPYLIKFVFHHLKRMDLALMNVGSAVPSMTKTAYSHIPILMPAEPKLEAFEIEASHYYDKVRSNNESIQNLRTQRDTLLPKLMSGEVRVQNTRIDE